jgi:hypothetical protein
LAAAKERMSEGVSVRATVRLALNVKCSSHWPSDVTVAQVQKQALEEAEEIIRKALVGARAQIEILWAKPVVLAFEPQEKEPG